LTGSPAPRIWTLVVATLVVLGGWIALEQWILQGYVILSSRQVLAGGELPALPRLDAFYGTLPGILLEASLSAAWIGMVALVAATLSTVPLRTRLGLVPARAGALAWLLVPLGGMAVSQGVDYAFALSGAGRGPVIDGLLTALATARGVPLAMAVLVIGGLSATCEELFFRGYLQRRLVARIGPVLGIALPAALFGLAHGELHHALFAFAFGLFVGWAAWVADSTWIAIAAHVANNTASVLASASGIGQANGTRPQEEIALATSVVVVALVVTWLARRTAHGERAARAA